MPPHRVYSEAPPVARQNRNDAPGAKLPCDKKATPPLEPSASQDAAEHVQRPVEEDVIPVIKPLLAHASQPAAAVAPQVRHCGTASAPQPLARHPSEPSPIPLPVSREPRRRGCPRNCLAPVNNRSVPSALPAADPFWQPFVPLHRVNDAFQRPEARAALPANSGGR